MLNRNPGRSRTNAVRDEKTSNSYVLNIPIQVHTGAQGPFHGQGFSPHYERKRTNISYQEKILTGARTYFRRVFSAWKI